MNSIATLVHDLPLLSLSAGLLMLFSALAAFDGVGLHLLKYRLHARAESYTEHLWHTASALLFVPVLAWLLVPDAGGITLWLGLLALVATHVVEAFDVRAERESRRTLGGLSRGEFAVHIAALVSRTGAVAALLLSRPLGAWSLSFTAPAASNTSILGVIHPVLVWGTIGTALLHVTLAITHCPRCLGRRSCWATA